jgi:hypothetical protein
MTESYPRPLRVKERELLEAVLPLDRPGYRLYRKELEHLVVIGEGRQGAGNLILGSAGMEPETSAPLTPVVAYGVVETTRETLTVTVREVFGGQIDVEIVTSHGEEIPDHFEEKRRWTYSSWQPGQPSPATGTPVHEVAIDSSSILAISTQEKRLWLFDGTTGMNHPIPITNFYNELMLVKGIRAPEIALRSALLFENFHQYTDGEIHAAFIAYNRFRKRVELHPPALEPSAAGIRMRVQSLFRRKKSHG